MRYFLHGLAHLRPHALYYEAASISQAAINGAAEIPAGSLPSLIDMSHCLTREYTSRRFILISVILASDVEHATPLLSHGETRAF